jgi:predicted DNA-binding transcriptional regulator YafY
MLLQVHGKASATELAQRLEVSVRTIYRDIQALSDAGLPVVSVSGTGGGYRLAEGYRSSIALTETEMQALMIGPASEDVGLGAFLNAAFLKLLASLPAGGRQRAEQAASLFHLDAPLWFEDHAPLPILIELTSAMSTNRRITGGYRGLDRILDPLGLVSKAGVWYLLARENGEIRVYRASRFTSIEIRDEGFARPVDFDLERSWVEHRRAFESSRPRVMVEFRVRVGDIERVRANLDPVGRSALADVPAIEGADWITVTLPFEGLDHAFDHLIRLGASIEVQAPTALRSRLAESAQDVAALYAASALANPT